MKIYEKTSEFITIEKALAKTMLHKDDLAKMIVRENINAYYDYQKDLIFVNKKQIRSLFLRKNITLE